MKRKYKKSDEKSLETKAVLSNLLVETNKVKTLLSEFLFQYSKRIEKIKRRTSDYENDNKLAQFAKRNQDKIGKEEFKGELESKLTSFEQEEIKNFLENSIEYFRHQKEINHLFEDTKKDVDSTLEESSKKLENIILASIDVTPLIYKTRNDLVSLIRKAILTKIGTENDNEYLDSHYEILIYCYKLENQIAEKIKKL